MRLLLLILIVSSLQAQELRVGEILPTAVITEADGGYVNGGDFSTDDLRGKVHVMMYVDPDKSDDGKKLNEALRAAKDNFPQGSFRTVAIVNMAATWLPNFAIAGKLHSKQKKYPNARFVKDERSVLVKSLALENDAYYAILIDPQGKVIRFSKAPFSDEEVKLFINRVNQEVQSFGATAAMNQ